MEQRERRVSETLHDCPICLSSATNSPLVSTPCGHTFHFVCIERNLQSSSNCPSCRQAITVQQRQSMLQRSVELQETDERMRPEFVPRAEFEALEIQFQDLFSRHTTLEQQFIGLRGQVLSIRVQQSPSIIAPSEPQQTPARRIMTRSVTRAASARAASTIAPSSQTPSSVTRTSGLRRYHTFCRRRAFRLENEHPDLSRRAIRDMVRAEWRSMTPTQRDHVQL
eukprot:4690566-Pyramimonas_sp.AAC.1